MGLEVRAGDRLLRVFAGRFLALLALLGSGMWLSGDSVVQALLPVLRATVELVEHDHQVDSLALDHEGADRVVRLVVRPTHYIVLGGKVIAPHPEARANASTLAGHVQLSLVLLLASAFALPAAGAMASVLRLIAVVGAALICLALDLPLTLLASLWGLYLEVYTPDAWSPLVAWAGFLQGGGRYALPLALGLCVGWFTSGLRHQCAHAQVQRDLQIST